jgi:hypothetical protein
MKAPRQNRLAWLGGDHHANLTIIGFAASCTVMFLGLVFMVAFRNDVLFWIGEACLGACVLSGVWGLVGSILHHNGKT